MRDELEIVRSLGVDDRVLNMQGLARAEAALRREVEREPTAVAPLNGPAERTSVRAGRAFVRRARTGHRRRRWALGLVIPVAIVAGGATYALTRSSVDYAAGFGCYDRVSLNANVAVPGGDASNPVAACAAVWREGALGRPGSHTVPPQTACVLPSGAVGVFPSGEPGTCARLQLARLPADYAREAARFGELASTLRGVLDAAGGRCLTAAQAQAVASRELVALGFTGWRVRVPAPFAAGDRCAGVDFGQWQRTVFVVSAPRPTPSLAAARRAFAAARVGIDPRTVEFVAGDGGYAAYTGSPQAGSRPCAVVLGAGAPRVACAHGRGISTMVVRLVNGSRLVAGIVSPPGAAAGGVQVRLDQQRAAGLTFAANLPTPASSPSRERPVGRVGSAANVIGGERNAQFLLHVRELRGL